MEARLAPPLPLGRERVGADEAAAGTDRLAVGGRPPQLLEGRAGVFLTHPGDVGFTQRSTGRGKEEVLGHDWLRFVKGQEEIWVVTKPPARQ